MGTIVYDAVLFDLDGTLVATDRFWVDAARRGAQRALRELKLERELPSAREWLNLVGLPLAEGFRQLFPDLDAAARARLLSACLEEEQRALQHGGAALLPAVEETLAECRARGLALGIASNCGAAYLEAMWRELGLNRWVHEARCLDTPGMSSKRAMLADLMHSFRAQSAVMVGDRQGDRDAAWANGLPHIHCTRGFASAEESFAAEARIEDFSELIGVLEARGAWLERCWEPWAANTTTLGISGAPGVGVADLARDWARIVERSGRAVRVLDLEDYARVERLSSTAFQARERPLESWMAAYELDRLLDRDLRPQGSELVILHGLSLAHPPIATQLDRRVHATASEATCWRRLAAQGEQQVLGARRFAWPLSQALGTPPGVDARVELDNALRPQSL